MREIIVKLSEHVKEEIDNYRDKFMRPLQPNQTLQPRIQPRLGYRKELSHTLQVFNRSSRTIIIGPHYFLLPLRNL